MSGALLFLLLVFLMGSSGEISTPAPTSFGVAEVMAILNQFGFPVLVAVWFMYRIEKRLDRFTEQLEKLYTVVTVLTKVIDDK